MKIWDVHLKEETFARLLYQRYARILIRNRNKSQALNKLLF
jgi:hypothetical protein